MTLAVVVLLGALTFAFLNLWCMTLDLLADVRDTLTRIHEYHDHQDYRPQRSEESVNGRLT